MKTILQSVIAVMCLAGFSSLSFAGDMGMKDAMKGEMKAEKDAMKAKKGAMKDEMKAKKDAMKAKKGAMKDEMKAKKDAMKGKMTEKMGEMTD